MVTGRGLANGCYRIDLVRIERDEFLDREHLVVRPLVAPGRVFRTARERVVRRLALEGAIGLVARAHEPLHLHVLARDVVDGGVGGLLEPDGILRVGDELALELDLHAHARRLRRDAMVGVLLETGTAVGAHEDPPCFLAVFQISVMRPSGSGRARMRRRSGQGPQVLHGGLGLRQGRSCARADMNSYNRNHRVRSIGFNRRRRPCVSVRMRRIVMLLVLALLAPSAARASSRPVEVHQLLALPQPGTKIAALTLDACGGGYDARLIRFLVGERIPATVFATRKWIERNAEGVAMLRSHPELFDIEDHGANHVPAVIGLDRRVYGIAGNPDAAHLESEVHDGAAAVEAATGSAPPWYAGATLKRETIAARLNAVGPGDIIIAHMNKPGSDTAEGLASGLKSLLLRGFHFVTLREMDVRPALG